MGKARIRIDPDDPNTIPQGRIAPAVVDATTEAGILLQERKDEAEAMQIMAASGSRPAGSSSPARGR